MKLKIIKRELRYEKGPDTGIQSVSANFQYTGYIEEAMVKLEGKVKNGMKIEGGIVNILHFADDIFRRIAAEM